MSESNPIAGIEQAFPAALKQAAQTLSVLFHAYIEEHMELEAGSAGSEHVGVRSGRLTRSLMKGQPDNLERITVTGSGLDMEFGTSVPYAGRLEEGGGPYMVPATDRLTAFMWRRWFETQNPMFRAAAIKAKHQGFLQHPATKAKPFLKPAMEKLQDEGLRIANDELIETLARAI